MAPDPFSEPQAQDLLKLDVGEIDAAAQIFTKVHTQAGEAARGLRTTQDDSSWTGSSADQFKSSIGKMPSQLDQIQTGYASVATGLSSYASQAGDLQGQFKVLKQAYDSLGPQLAQANTAAGAANGKLRGLVSMPHNGSSSAAKAIQNAGTDATSADSKASQLQGEVDQVTTKAQQVLTEFAQLLTSTVNQVNGGARSAPAKPGVSFMSVLDSALHGLEDTGKFAVGLVTSTFKSIVDLPGATVAMIKDPSPANVGKFLTDATTTAAAVAMVAAPFAAPELAEAAAGEDGGEDAASDVAEDAAEKLTAEAEDGESQQSIAQQAKEWIKANSHDNETAATIRDRALSTAKATNGATVLNDVKQGKYDEALDNMALSEIAPGDAVAGKLSVTADQVDEAEQTYYRAQVQEMTDAGMSKQAAEQATFDGDAPDWFTQPAAGKIPSVQDAKTELAEKEYKYNRGGLQTGQAVEKAAESGVKQAQQAGQPSHRQAQPAGATS